MDKDKRELLDKLKAIVAKAEKDETMDFGDTINDVEDLMGEYEEEE